MCDVASIYLLFNFNKLLLIKTAFIFLVISEAWDTWWSRNGHHSLSTTLSHFHTHIKRTINSNEKLRKNKLQEKLFPSSRHSSAICSQRHRQHYFLFLAPLRVPCTLTLIEAETVTSRRQVMLRSGILPYSIPTCDSLRRFTDWLWCF